MSDEKKAALGMLVSRLKEDDRVRNAAFVEAALGRLNREHRAVTTQHEKLKASLDPKTKVTQAIESHRQDEGLLEKRAHEKQAKIAQEARAKFEKDDLKRGWFAREFSLGREKELKEVVRLEGLAKETERAARLTASKSNDRISLENRTEAKAKKDEKEAEPTLDNIRYRLTAIDRMKDDIKKGDENSFRLARTVMMGERGIDKGIDYLERADEAEEFAREGTREDRRKAYAIKVTDFEGTRTDGITDPQGLERAYDLLSQQCEDITNTKREENTRHDKEMVLRHNRGMNEAEIHIAEARETYDLLGGYHNADLVLKAQAQFDSMEAQYAQEAWLRVADREKERERRPNDDLEEEALGRAIAARDSREESQGREEKILYEISTASKAGRDLVPGGEKMTKKVGFPSDDGRQAIPVDMTQFASEEVATKPVQSGAEDAAANPRKPTKGGDDRPPHNTPTGAQARAATHKQNENLNLQAREEIKKPKGPTEDDTIKR